MDSTFYEQLGRRIAKLRTDRGLTQEALGEGTEISANYVAKIEIGRAKPTLDALGQIADALDVPLWRLLVDGNRLTHEEKLWQRSAREIAKLTAELARDDLKLLAGIARRLGKS